MQYFLFSPIYIINNDCIRIMKKVNHKSRILLSTVCSAALALMGSGCSSDEVDPTSDGIFGVYYITGHVTTEDGREVEGATIRVTNPEFESSRQSYDTWETNKEGFYILSGMGSDTELKVVCIPYGTTLVADSVIVDVVYKGNPLAYYSDSRIRGEANIKLDFKLKEKKSKE